MTTKLEQAARQALDALEVHQPDPEQQMVTEAITALREALAEREANQAEQEKPYADKAAMFAQLGGMVRIDPVTGDVGIGTPSKTLDYAAPVRTKDLTDDEIASLAKKINGIYYDCDIEFARAVIAADREKNK